MTKKQLREFADKVVQICEDNTTIGDSNDGMSGSIDGAYLDIDGLNIDNQIDRLIDEIAE